MLRLPITILLTFISLIAATQVIPYNTIPDWSTQANGHIATGLGLADINGDGFKDLVVANGNDIERQNLVVYYNQGDGTFHTNPDWQSADIDYHGHLACGDLDNDGDVDVAVSVYIGASGFSSPGRLKVYYNTGNELESNPSFVSDPFYTFSCALGDADADGDLDIAAVAGEPYGGLLDYGKIFINNNGTFQQQAEWQSSVQMGSLDVEFGDFNRDGFMDLIFVCEGTPAMIYLANSQGIIDEDPDWQSAEAESYINSVDVGYPDNSSSMVVMTENNQLGGDGKVRKYDFNSVLPASNSASWYSSPFGYGSGIMLNDMDLDGYTDLVYGGWWLPVKIALGDGNGFELNTSYTSSTASVVEAILMADLDRVDETTEQEMFSISPAMVGTNLLVIPKPVVEDIQDIYLNGILVPPTGYKHVPGKPWITFTDPFQTGDQVLVNYLYSPYPDMVVTNWDANKGNYIFYNTESSVGVEEHGGMGAWGHGGLKVWPVPAKERIFIRCQPTFTNPLKSGGGSMLWIEIFDVSGRAVTSLPWPDPTKEMQIETRGFQAGFYSILIKDNHSVIKSGKFIIE